jgi:hypothetical protein
MERKTVDYHREDEYYVDRETRSGARKYATAPFSGPIRITRTETVPMTAAEYDSAVEALAVLLASFWDDHLGPSTP